MNIEEIEYKGSRYRVWNPGGLVFSTSRKLSGSNKFEILDQLDELKDLKFTKHTRSRSKYLKEKYGLSEQDYYIIVVLKGDETKQPRCPYEHNNGKVCMKYCKFRSLIPTTNKGKPLGIYFTSCEEHINRTAPQLAQKERVLLGTNNLQHTDRRSKSWRKKLSISAKNQIASGNSIFSPDDVRRSDLPSYIGYVSNKNTSIKNYSDKIEISILIDKERYLLKGDQNDICYYYITDLIDLDGIGSEYIKLGVTNNIDRRYSETNKDNRKYHGYYYGEIESLFSGPRTVVAELEYQVKLKFIKDIVLGTEGFLRAKKEEIIDFINNYLKNLQ